MSIRSRLMTGLLATTLTLGGSAAVMAQDATPDASPAASPAAPQDNIAISNPEGDIVGYATIIEGDNGVTISVESKIDSGLAPGDHGIHIHEVGSCDASGTTPYASAGGHFNPTGGAHGTVDDAESHAGDLGNMSVNDDGTYTFEVTTNKVTLEEGAENSLVGNTGTSLVIHADADDLSTDPAGESGDRVACGIISASVEPAFNDPYPSASPAASPVASPEASPAS